MQQQVEQRPDAPARMMGEQHSEAGPLEVRVAQDFALLAAPTNFARLAVLRALG